MRKKLFTFLLALVTSVGMSWATDPIVITTNTQQSSYIHSTVIITCDNDGDGDGFAIGGNTGYTATITNLGSSTISEIVLVPGYYKSNHPYVRANGAAPTTSSNDLITFTDVNSNSVTLSMSTTNNFQIKEVRVTLVGGGSTDQDVADAVIALINAIPNPVEYNATCYDAIALARALYDNLTDAQKALVSNYSTLTAAEAAYAALAPQPVSGDVLPGAFTINGDGDQINFSKANLQYAGSPATWKFAENQWSIIGAAQADDNRDLFGWGTGDAPNKVSSELSDYADYHEWGENMGEGWYTLSRDEWYYLFKTRDNASTLCGPAVVNGVSGIIILPDDWTLPGGMSFNPSATNFGANAYADEAWETMENAGAVFLPVAGYRYNGNINWVGQSGYYWSSSVASAGASAWCYRLTKDNVSREYYNLHYGMCVRLVKAVVKSDQEFADPVIALINAIGTVEYTQVCKNRIAAARAAYDHLTDAQKALVINYSTLTNAEATYASLAPTPATDGSLSGAFTINGDGDQINFSKGNLQFVGSWQFAEDQWSIIGNAQADDNRDLFGWGTGDAPNKVSMTLADYAEYHEWGTNMGDGWYTLSRDEWTYLFQTRTNAANLYAPANVNGVNGFVVLPDEWVQPYGTTFTPGVTNYGTNVYADAAWTSMEDAGAVFLPVAGYRYNGNVNWQGQSGFYWSSTVASEGASAWSWLISASDGARRDYYNLYYGMPVRLVKAVVKSDQEFADPVIALIEAIGTVEYTQDCKNRIDAARAAYDHLTDAQKALVINYSTLTNAEAAYAALAPTPATDGSLPGAFTINGDGDQINFSKANLQYVGKWQFAENQWDIIGAAQADDNRDLFGWGTGDAPNKVSETSADYTTYTEWGTQMGAGWYTLDYDEWKYIFKTRANASDKYAPAKVNGVNGIVLLPDEWTQPYGTTFTAGVTNFGTNVYADAAWTSMEEAGAVFLPVAGYRYKGNINWVGESGFYWTSTVASAGSLSWSWLISASSVSRDYYNLHYGMSVRLVKAASSTPVGPTYLDADFAIDFMSNPYTVVGGGDLPTGVEVTGDFNDAQHGYRLPAITIPVTAGNYLVKMGTCRFSNQDGSVKNEDGSVTYTTLATNTGVCYDANPSKNYVADIITIPSDQIIKVYGAEYTPYFAIEKMAAVPAFEDFEISFQSNPYDMISGAKPEGTVIAGSFHDGQHGYQNVEATVPVKAGKYRLTLGACGYGNGAGNVMSETNVELASFNQKLAEESMCYVASTGANTVSVIFDVDKDQTITIDCGQYTPYMKLEAVTAYQVSFALSDAEGSAPAAVDVTIGEALTMPVNKTMCKDGYTLTGWSDGVNTYPIGESFTPANDVVLTPVFTANEADLLNASNDVTVKWYFGGGNGAPTTSYEGTSGLLVAQATIGDKTVDVKLAIDATSGKFAPQPTTEWAQVTVGTIFTYPYKEGMTVKVDNYKSNVTYYIADAEGKVTCCENDHYSFIEVTYPASTPTPAVVIGDPNDADQVTAFLNTYNGQTIDELIIDRPVLNNMYNTLCLPFDMNAAQITASSLNGVEIREFTGASVEGTTLNLSVGDPVNAVVAGRPYFVKYSAATQLDDLHFEDVTINNALLDNMAVTFDGVTFKGTFTPFVMPNGLNFQGGYLFLGQNNQLFWPGTSNPLKPFRAYFYVNVESSTPGNAPKYRGMPARIVEGKNVATGVENAQSANQSTKVIVNGQLIIIKNDVRYNAQGQIVK